MVNQDRSQDPQYMSKLQAKGQTVTLAAQMLPTPVAPTGAGGPKGLDGGSRARQMLTDAGFPRAAGAPSSLPTPYASFGMAMELSKRQTEKRRNRGKGPNLEEAIAWMLPTPTVNDAGNSTLPPSQRGRDSLPGQMLRDDSVPTGPSTHLNPSFVEEMMGYPVGWTA